MIRVKRRCLFVIAKVFYLHFQMSQTIEVWPWSTEAVHTWRYDFCLLFHTYRKIPKQLLESSSPQDLCTHSCDAEGSPDSSETSCQVDGGDARQGGLNLKMGFVFLSAVASTDSLSPVHKQWGCWSRGENVLGSACVLAITCYLSW